MHLHHAVALRTCTMHLCTSLHSVHLCIPCPASDVGPVRRPSSSRFGRARRQTAQARTDEVEARWRGLDEDGDDVLRGDEVGAALHSLVGAASTDALLEESDELFATLDANHDQVIARTEYMEWMLYDGTLPSDRQLAGVNRRWQLWLELDADSDGVMRGDEVHRFTAMLALVASPTSYPELESWLGVLDANGDGVIARDEYWGWIQHYIERYTLRTQKNGERIDAKM